MTIHFLLGLSTNKYATVSLKNSIIDIWPIIEFIIIDEISMVDCNMFIIMHLKLQKFKTIILPFGGVNMMFMGGFLQFPPMTNTL